MSVHNPDNATGQKIPADRPEKWRILKEARGKETRKGGG